jgi:branched-chain amino acid transport system permease protein
MELPGIALFLVGFFTTASIYAIFTLGLNVQWGFTGQFNIGIHGFWAVGAYTAAILSTEANPDHLGGFGMPFIVGLLAAGILSGAVGLLVAVITVRLRTDYLAIATIGIAEIIRLGLKNAEGITNTVRGIWSIPRPLQLVGGNAQELIFLAVVLAVLAITYFAVERAHNSPWGRVLRAIRENEPATMAAGKNVLRFRLQAFVLGAVIMGIGGALYAHAVRFISPDAFNPLQTTFIIWVMLIVGGSGNNRGAIFGAVAIWLIWTCTQFLIGSLPSEWAVQIAPARVLIIGILLQVILITRPEGLFPETLRQSRSRSPAKRDM